MAKDLKPRRPRAETPKGFRDYFGAEVFERKAMLDRIAEVYHRHGFDALETSGIETVEALGKFLPDVDRPNAGVFAWQDEDESWLALRYDLTAPLARAADMIIGPAITNGSLLAIITFLPALIAARVGRRPIAPTMADITSVAAGNAAAVRRANGQPTHVEQVA